MKVAFVKQKYVAYGGGEKYLERLMRACLEASCEVHLITTSWPPDGLPGVRVHGVSFRSRSRAARIRSFSEAAARYAAEQSFEVVFSLDRTARQDIWRAGEGVHRVWLERRRLFEPAWKAWLNERAPGHRAMLETEERAVRNTPHIITNSDMVRRDIEAVYGAEHGELHVIRNGVDTEAFSPAGREEHCAAARAEWGIDAGAPLLLFVGTGYRRKGLAELLAALTDCPEHVLLVLGRDRDPPWKKRLAALGLKDRVRFLPARPDLVPLYHAADAVVFPSWFDTFGNIGLEAMRCGTPLITTRFAGVHELVQPDVNGDVIDRPDHLDALRMAILSQTERRGDPKRPEQIAASVEHCTMAENCRQTMDVIRRVMERTS